jgi:hypothetical protein
MERLSYVLLGVPNTNLLLRVVYCSHRYEGILKGYLIPMTVLRLTDDSIFLSAYVLNS